MEDYDDDEVYDQEDDVYESADDEEVEDGYADQALALVSGADHDNGFDELHEPVEGAAGDDDDDDDDDDDAGDDVSAAKFCMCIDSCSN